MPPRFLDTNVLIRYFTRDDEAKARASLALLLRVERGDEAVETSTIVVFETVYALQRIYHVPKPRVRELVLPILELQGLRLPGKRLCIEALDIYAGKNVSFADAYHVAYMRSRMVAEIYSWDRDFDRSEGVTRVEPGE